MIINESLNAQSLRQGQTATQIFTISNENDVPVKSAIEIKETQPTDSPILKTFTVNILTDDETQASIYGPTTFQELVSHGYTTLELLEPHMKRQYRMTFTPAEKVADSFQDTALTYNLLIGTENMVENTIKNTTENTPVETPVVTLQPEKAVIKELAKTAIPSPSIQPREQVLGTSSAALSTQSQLTQSEQSQSQSPSSTPITFLLIAGLLTALLFSSMILIFRLFIRHSTRSSLNSQHPP